MNFPRDYMSPKEALLSVREAVEKLGDSKAIYSFYLEFSRGLEVLKLVEKYCKLGGLVLDLDAQPFILSGTLKKMGYRAIAFDIASEPYIRVAEVLGVEVIKADLEKDELNIFNVFNV